MGNLRYQSDAIDWHSLNVGTNSFGDIDGLLEKNGRFLVLEAKHVDERGMSDGQDKTLRSLSLVPFITVVAIYYQGDKSNPEFIEWQQAKDGRWLSLNQTTNEQFKRRVSEWLAKAQEGDDNGYSAKFRPKDRDESLV